MSREARNVRLSIEIRSSENAALRAELDRLREGLMQPAGSAAPRPASRDLATAKGLGNAPEVPDERLLDLGRTYRESLLRAMAGDEDAGEATSEAVRELVRSGPASFAILRDVYRSTPDTRARAAMLRAMVRGNGTELPDFIAHELRTEPDGELRRALADRAAGLATPENAPRLRDALLEIIATDADPETRASAVYGLHFVRDSDVDEALLSAAADGSEEVRLAAVSRLAGRPSSRDRLTELVARDPSSQVRDVARCKVLLAESPAP